MLRRENKIWCCGPGRRCRRAGGQGGKEACRRRKIALQRRGRRRRRSGGACRVRAKDPSPGNPLQATHGKTGGKGLLKGQPCFEENEWVAQPAWLCGCFSPLR